MMVPGLFPGPVYLFKKMEEKNMLETIKKSLLTGVGMALRSKKEIEAFAKEFAEQSEMNQKEATDFLEECKKRS